MREFIEGSAAIAKIIRMCKPGVISAYPITPQTHIGENLAQFIADGEMKCEFVNSESEHSSASIILGASAVGVRAYNSTSSQGLLLMLEVLYSIAGMRFPLVLTCANRAVSSPINIWNDQQDSVTLRDSGWIQFYAETNQEACDLHIQAYRIAEDHNVYLPTMVCIDGYLLTHAVEVIELPEQEQVDKFLPPLEPLHVLDPENPVSMGVLYDPAAYMETRYAIQETMKDALELIPVVADEFKAMFGRESGGLIQEYKIEDADKVIVAMGSVVSTIKETVDEMRDEGEKVGAIKVVTHRPLPSQSLYNSLKHIPEIAVLDKSISLGASGPLYMDLKYIFQGKNASPKISGFIGGLGGRDVTKDSIRNIFDRLSGEQVDHEFMDLNVEQMVNAT
jgi:pyruvate ferredoxin oxidoreductase alpha subunit